MPGASFNVSRQLHAPRLYQAVENRRAYTIDTAERNIYETQHSVELHPTNQGLAGTGMAVWPY